MISALLPLLFVLAADPAPATKPASVAELLAQSAPTDWRPLDPAHTLYVDLPHGRMVIELAPDFAPRHAKNIETLAHAHYFDGLAILRSQDNYVVQWGDPDGDDPKRARSLAPADAKLPAEFSRDSTGVPFTVLPDPDTYAPEVGFAFGFPAARDAKSHALWMTHCYGAVGAGRDMAKDSSTGAELYVVIGHSPRHLDRNITVVGRVVQGIELLSTLPRGSGALGFYEKPSERVTLKDIKLAADVPEAQREPIELLRTDTPLFQRYVDARRNRRDPWFADPVGHVELCNVGLPARKPPTK